MGIDYTIISKPDYIIFECPHCKEDVEVGFSEVDFNTDYWGDGAVCNCPKCGEEVELDGYEYDWWRIFNISSFKAILVDTNRLDELCIAWRERNIREVMEEMNMYTNYDDLINNTIYLTKEEYEKLIVNPFEIKEINIIVPNKVVEVIFADDHKEKMICHQDDEFDLRRCLFIAIAKRKYKQSYTCEGIEYKATELSMMKEYVKIVDKAIKAYKKKLVDIAKAENEHKAYLERAEKKRIKKAERDARRSNAVKEEMIEVQKEAYIRAIDEIENRKIVAAK